MKQLRAPTKGAPTKYVFIFRFYYKLGNVGVAPCAHRYGDPYLKQDLQDSRIFQDLIPEKWRAYMKIKNLKGFLC